MEFITIAVGSGISVSYDTAVTGKKNFPNPAHKPCIMRKDIDDRPHKDVLKYYSKPQKCKQVNNRIQTTVYL